MTIRNFVIYITVCVIILSSFKVPEILLNNVSDNIENEVYEKTENDTALDIETENIYLVKVIHYIENENNPVEIVTSANEWNLVVTTEYDTLNVDDELLKLKEYDILKDFEISKNGKYSIKLINKFYQNYKEKYVVNNVLFEANNVIYRLEIENKIKKILNISIQKDKLNVANREELLVNFVKYLDLYIVGDWSYSDNVLKSEKARLVVSLEEKNDEYCLAVHSSNYKNR